MKYVTFSLASDVVPRLGVVRGDRVIEDAMLPSTDWRPPATMLDLIQQGPDAWRRMRELVDRTQAGIGHPIAEIRWHAPIPRPTKNVFCLGRNYVAHAEEAARARGQESGRRARRRLSRCRRATGRRGPSPTRRQWPSDRSRGSGGCPSRCTWGSGPAFSSARWRDGS